MKNDFEGYIIRDIYDTLVPLVGNKNNLLGSNISVIPQYIFDDDIGKIVLDKIFVKDIPGNTVCISKIGIIYSPSVWYTKDIVKSIKEYLNIMNVDRGIDYFN